LVNSTLLAAIGQPDLRAEPPLQMRAGVRKDGRRMQRGLCRKQNRRQGVKWYPNEHGDIHALFTTIDRKDRVCA
jgi:hypothetical protein